METESDPFDKRQKLSEFRRHCEKYAQLKDDFEEIKSKFLGMRETLIRWQGMFKQRDIDWESEIDFR